MTLSLYLRHQTDFAKMFTRGPGLIVSQKEKIWLPRTHIKSLVKFPPAQTNLPPLCQVEIPDWVAQQKGLA